MLGKGSELLGFPIKKEGRLNIKTAAMMNEAASIKNISLAPSHAAIAPANPGPNIPSIW